MSSAPQPCVAVDLRPLVQAQRAGIGWFTLSLVRALLARGRVRLIGMAHRELREREELTQAGMQLCISKSLVGLYWQRVRVRRELRALPVDLFWSPVNTLPFLRDMRSVVTLHDLSPVLLPETQSLKVRLGFAPFLRRTVRHADRIVTASQASHADIVQRFPAAESRVRVVPHGVEPDFQPADEAARAAVRTRYGCPQGFVLYAGTLEPRKNIELLLTAWSALRRRRPETPPLFLMGAKGWRNRELYARIEAMRTDGLRYLGYLPREELVRVFQAARAFVYPSRYEGFGLPPLEAMACGVPTLVSNASSMPEVVGSAGLVFDPDDATELEAQLERALFDAELARDLQRRGTERAAEFTWDRAAAGMEAVFAELAPSLAGGR